MSLWRKSIADDGFDPESEFQQARERTRDAAAAHHARLLATAREGDGWCAGLAEASRLGHRWCTWVPVSGECPFTAQASADRFEASFAAQAEQQNRAARVAAADPFAAPVDGDIVARWIEGGDYAVRGKDSRRIAAWLDAPAAFAPPAAAINNPFAALAALKVQ